MNHYSVKMSDGSRYDFKAEQLPWTLSNDYLQVEYKDKYVRLNERHIVSITIKRNADDSKTILEPGKTD